MKVILASTFLFLCLYLPAQKITLPAEVKKSIEKRIEYGFNPGIVVGLINENGSAYYNFGVRKKGGKKVDEHTIYEIGSITKVFTGILLADKVVKGEMSVDDPAQNYLPAHVKLPVLNDKIITLGYLADHRSGLPRLPANMQYKDLLNPYADYTVELMYEFLSSYELTREPGSAYEYSNLAVGLLGHILGLKSGASYETLLLNTIAQPLGMMETKITLDGNMKNHLAIGHANEVEVPNWDLPALAGAGAIRSSTHDLVKFLAANMGLKPNPLSAAMQISQVPRYEIKEGLSSGLGWQMDESPSGDIIWHNGGTGGYRSFIGFIKNTKTGVVVMTNSDQDVDDIGFHVLNPESPLNDIRPRMAKYLRALIDKEGTTDLEKKFARLKNDKGYEVNEIDINALGYWYMNDRKNLDAAAALFKINVIEFPNSSNVYDSYGEALMNQGKKEEAIVNYKKSLELNPGNVNAVEMLAKMGVKHEMKKLEVAENVLALYDGTYQLFAGFNLVISHEGTHLYAQATGQAKYEIFATSPAEFYYEVVDARIVFSKDQDGEWMLTLFQNGQEMTGKRL